MGPHASWDGTPKKGHTEVFAFSYGKIYNWLELGFCCFWPLELGHILPPRIPIMTASSNFRFLHLKGQVCWLKEKGEFWSEDAG